MNTNGVMLNAYPDSCGGNLSALVSLLADEDFKDVFEYLYILPSMFQSDLDRGFSIVSYDLNEDLARKEDIESLHRLGIGLKLDFVLNHLSVRSPQFQKLLLEGDSSPYLEMFIDWNEFWKGHSHVGVDGHAIPKEEHLAKLFMRKPQLPILKVPFPDGSSRYYWNTFYQKIDPHDAKNILGQVDLNAKSPLVWQFYNDTIEKLAAYGARIVRLDAFAYLHKEVGAKNFFNEPGTWEYLRRIRGMVADKHIELLPEIHATHAEGMHRKLANEGYRFYDFFFPSLIIDALENGDASRLVPWIEEIRTNGYRTVNMLGCHDGIPVLDASGLLDSKRIENLIKLITDRGGFVKNLYDADGRKISYYQVNATFFSALAEDEKKLLLARAIQIFMPGIPQVWYLDLFGGTNDYQAASRDGHKEINRTSLSREELKRRTALPLVQKQLKLLKFRNTFKAFGHNAHLSIDNSEKSLLCLKWEYKEYQATLEANLASRHFTIHYGKGAEKHTLM